MQTQTELLPPLAIQPDEVGKPLTRQEQFQHALNVANQYRSRNPRKAFQAIATNYLVIGACVAVSEYIHVFFPTCANVVTLFSYSIACLILPITRYWAEASEHLGMDMGSKFSHSRSNLGFGHRWYMHPHNDGYHGVHHIHSQVPFHQLPEAHKALMNENTSFRKEAVISKGIMQTFWQMVTVKTTWQRTVGEKALIS